MTKMGAPCRSFVPAGRTLCLAHDPDRQVVVWEARAKGGAKASKIRAIQGRRAKLATMAELVRFTASVIHDVREEARAPEVGRAVLYGLSLQRHLVEASDLEARLATLEAEAAQAAQSVGPSMTHTARAGGAEGRSARWGA